MHIHTHTYTYIHIHTHTYTYIHIHAYIHTLGRHAASQRTSPAGWSTCRPTLARCDWRNEGDGVAVVSISMALCRSPCGCACVCGSHVPERAGLWVIPLNPNSSSGLSSVCLVRQGAVHEHVSPMGCSSGRWLGIHLRARCHGSLCNWPGLLETLPRRSRNSKRSPRALAHVPSGIRRVGAKMPGRTTALLAVSAPPPPPTHKHTHTHTHMYPHVRTSPAPKQTLVSAK